MYTIDNQRQQQTISSVRMLIDLQTLSQTHIEKLVKLAESIADRIELTETAEYHDSHKTGYGIEIQRMELKQREEMSDDDGNWLLPYIPNGSTLSRFFQNVILQLDFNLSQMHMVNALRDSRMWEYYDTRKTSIDEHFSLIIEMDRKEQHQPEDDQKIFEFFE